VIKSFHRLSGDYEAKIWFWKSGYFFIENKDEEDLLAQSKLVLSMFECEK
jgi:hypothetical protein